MNQHHMKKMRLLVGAVIFVFIIFAALLIYVVNVFLGQFRDRYAKIELSPQQSVWLHFKNNRLQMASSADALTQAKWIGADAEEWDHTSLPTVTLPVTAKTSDGFEKIQVNFDLFGSHCTANWELTQKDALGTEWVYTVDDSFETGTSPAHAPSNLIPRLGKPHLTAELKPDYDNGNPKLGVGLRFDSEGGEFQHVSVTDIQKDGKPVIAQIQLFDGNGKLIETIEEPLSELGFT